MDKIFLQGIQLPIRVGVADSERATPQPCVLDLEIGVDLSAAGRSGDLTRTIDYSRLLTDLEQLCLSRDFVLLEEVAEQAVELVWRNPLARQVRLRIGKVQPFTDKLQFVGVEFRRKRTI
jgi:7,8-dihydroneopterin aldolase/epimerase/oxygenase